MSSGNWGLEGLGWISAAGVSSTPYRAYNRRRVGSSEGGITYTPFTLTVWIFNLWRIRLPIYLGVIFRSYSWLNREIKDWVIPWMDTRDSGKTHRLRITSNARA